MDMIFRYLHPVDLNLVLVRYLTEQFTHSFSYVTTQYPFPVFRCPHKMIFRVVDGMAGAFDTHTISISAPSLRIHPRPQAGASFAISREEIGQILQLPPREHPEQANGHG